MRQVAVFFDPDTVFSAASISIRVALIAILGGIGTAVGPITARFFIIPLEELMNDWFSASVAGLSQLIFGCDPDRCDPVASPAVS